MKKTIKALFWAIVIMLSAVAVPSASVDNVPFVSTVSAASDTREITLYALDSDYSDYLTLPKGKDSYQIKVKAKSKVTYKVTNGKSVKVSDKGLIELNYETWYWFGNVGSSSPTMYGDRKPDRVQKKPITGDSVVSVKVGKKTYKYNVHVKEYAEYYASKKMDDYIKNHITSSTTDYQKLEYACKYAASYDYSPYAYDWVTMTVTGGGDCWASTAMIIEFLDRLGIEAKERDARSDYGAGSGHKNVLAKIGGKYYILEAGYNGKAPREYNIKEG